MLWDASDVGDRFTLFGPRSRGQDQDPLTLTWHILFLLCHGTMSDHETLLVPHTKAKFLPRKWKDPSDESPWISRIRMLCCSKIHGDSAAETFKDWLAMALAAGQPIPPTIAPDVGQR